MWLVWSLTAAAVWAAVNLADRWLLRALIPNPSAYCAIVGMFGILPGVVCLMLFDVSVRHWMGYLAIICGFTSLLCTLLYFQALMISSATAVVAMFQLVPVFTLLAAGIMGESITGWRPYVGCGLVVAGCAILAQEPEPSGRRWPFAQVRRAVVLMLLAACLLAACYAVESRLVRSSSVAAVYFWSRLGEVLFGLGLVLFGGEARDQLVMTVRRCWGRVLPVIGFAEGGHAVALYLLLLAYSLGPLAHVTTAAATQPLFLYVGLLLTDRTPPGSAGAVARRAIQVGAILAVVLGVFLLSSSGVRSP